MGLRTHYNGAMKKEKRKEKAATYACLGRIKLAFCLGSFMNCFNAHLPVGLMGALPYCPSTHKVVMLVLCGKRSIKCTSFGTFIVQCWA